MSNDVVLHDFPKPQKVGKGPITTERARRRYMGLELAAIAAVQMENGEYKRPGYTRQFQYGEDGKILKHENGHKVQIWNATELMRLAGYSDNTANCRTELILENEDFLSLVNYHRLRRHDPNWGQENEHLLWKLMGNEALRNLYERVFYAPHSMTTNEIKGIVELTLKAGIVLGPEGKLGEARSEKMIGQLSQADQRRLIDARKKDLKEQEQRLESLESAIEGQVIREEIDD